MGKRVLIVDDEAEDLKTMRMILENRKYEVKTAPDGTKALQILRDKRFDLIIIDILMPKLSGYELLRLLREKMNHDAKMLYASIVPKQEVDMTDIDGFIQKPFSPESFMEGVKKCLDR